MGFTVVSLHDLLTLLFPVPHATPPGPHLPCGNVLPPFALMSPCHFYSMTPFHPSLLRHPFLFYTPFSSFMPYAPHTRAYIHRRKLKPSSGGERLYSGTQETEANGCL